MKDEKNIAMETDAAEGAVSLEGFLDDNEPTAKWNVKALL